MKEKRIIEKVKDLDDAYEISTESGICFILSKDHKVVPKPEDTVTLYTFNCSSIRGVDINGEKVFYKSDEQLEKERKEYHKKLQKQREERFKKEKPKLDEKYKNLPKPFKDRIDKFRDNCDNFRVEYESYEMLCCVEAVKIANVFDSAEELTNFTGDLFKKCNLSDGHSGNTFGAAKFLAKVYLENPKHLKNIPAAIAPIVGQEKFEEKGEKNGK